MLCTENMKKIVSSVSKVEKTSILTIQVTLSAIILYYEHKFMF